MKNPDPGYLLPDGEAYTDDFACQLIYIPRKDEYYRAMLGAILYMGTWVAWERDNDKRGKDAAQAWREANELTLECWRMTNCLDDITDRMDEIIDLIALKKDCCDDNITYGPQVEVETDIEPNEGDPPDYYGETPVVDWEDWEQHVCHNAHIYVDILKQKAREMDVATVTAAWTIGFIAASLAALSFVGIGLAVVFGLAALTAGGLLAATTEGVFANTEADIEAARNDIVCALLNGLSLAEAVEAALNSGLDWDLFFQFIDYDSATAILYEGGYEQEYLPPDIREDCECELPGLFEYIWTEPDKQAWQDGRTFWEDGDLGFRALNTHNDFGVWCEEYQDEIAARFGLEEPLIINRVEADFNFWFDAGSSHNYSYFYFRVYTSTGMKFSPHFNRVDYGENEWFHAVWDIGQDVDLDPPTGFSLMVVLWCNDLTPPQGVLLRNLKYSYIG